MSMIPSRIAKGQSDTVISNDSICLFQTNNQPVFATIVGEKKSKYRLLNERGREVELTANRFHVLPGALPKGLSSQDQKISFLVTLHAECEAILGEIELNDLWTAVEDQSGELTVGELTSLYFGNDSLREHGALVLKLLSDQIYFKRNQFLFLPRATSVVDELLRAQEVIERKERKQQQFINQLKLRIKDHTSKLSSDVLEEIALLESLAA